MRERALALASLGTSGLYLWGALAFPLGTAARPGPGFFPAAVGVFLCLVAAAAVAATRRRRATLGAPAAPLSRDARIRVAVTAAGLVGFCLLLPWTGYPVAAFLLVAHLLRRLGSARWPGALVAAAACAGLSYYVFAVLLAVPLPHGILLD